MPLIAAQACSAAESPASSLCLPRVSTEAMDALTCVFAGRVSDRLSRLPGSPASEEIDVDEVSCESPWEKRTASWVNCQASVAISADAAR